MASRSRYNASEVLGLLDSDSLDDFGLVESEDSDCDDGEVGSYLPEVQPAEEEAPFSEEEVMEMDMMDTVPGAGKYN